MDLTAQYKQLNIPELSASEKTAVIAFIRDVYNEASAAYVEERFSIYDSMIVCYADEKLEAVQFVNEFSADGKKYFYLGSLFSRHTCFLPMFIHWLEAQWEQTDQEIHLSAEFQNPELFLFFKSLFCDYSYPLIDDHFIPEKIKKAALLFSEHIDHIHLLNPDNLSTASADSLFRSKSGKQAICHWMELRGVLCRYGYNQLLIVCLPNEKKKTILHQLKEISGNKEYRKEMIDRIHTLFEKSIPKNV